jgi:septum formation protein
MAEAGMDALCHIRAEMAENLRGFLHPRERNMRIDIRTGEEQASALKRSFMLARRARRADETAREAEHRAIGAGTARSAFEREAGALRKAHQAGLFRQKPHIFQRIEQFAHGLERLVELRLVRGEGGEERVRIPAPRCGLRRKEGDIGLGQGIGEIENAGRGRAAPMERDDRACRAGERRATHCKIAGLKAGREVFAGHPPEMGWQAVFFEARFSARLFAPFAVDKPGAAANVADRGPVRPFALMRTDVTSPAPPRLLLASASPRRFQLLDQIGLTPDDVVATAIDETPRNRERPRLYVERMAREKAQAARRIVAHDAPRREAVVLAADTVVALGARILPKNETIEEAAQCLRLLSGRAHRVYTSVVAELPSGRQGQRLVEARVRFKRLSAEELDAYLASGEWRGKAGGYAIQGIAGVFVTKLVGSYSAVVGLPLYETAALLTGLGYPVHLNWLTPRSL